MSDTEPRLNLPMEVLRGNEAANFNPPTCVIQEVPAMSDPTRQPPWYETGLFQLCREPDEIFFSFAYRPRRFATTGEQRVILFAGWIFNFPIALAALLFRTGDRTLRFCRILEPMIESRQCTPLDFAIQRLEFAAIRCGEIHVERSGQILLGRERRSGPCLHNKALQVIKRVFTKDMKVIELRAEASCEVGKGAWTISVIDGAGDSFSLLPQRKLTED